MSTGTVTLERLARDQRFDHQIALVREHWASVRRLWLDSAVPSGTTRQRVGVVSGARAGIQVQNQTDSIAPRSLRNYTSGWCQERANRLRTPELPLLRD